MPISIQSGAPIVPSLPQTVPVAQNRITTLATRALPQESTTWNRTLRAINITRESVEILFFRILEIVRPILGLRLEILWVRLVNIWERVKAEWKESEFQRTMGILQGENRTLKERVHELTQALTTQNDLAQKCNDLTQTLNSRTEENTWLKNLRELQQREIDLLKQTDTWSGQEKQALVQDKELLTQTRDQLLRENALLIQQNQLVISERDPLIRDNDQLRSENQKLMQERDQANTSLNLLLDRFQSVQKCEAYWQRIAVAAEKTKDNRDEGEIDDALSQLLPLLQQQKAEALAILQQTIPMLPPKHSSEIPLRILHRVFTEEGNYLQGVAQGIQIQTQLRGSFAQLLRSFKTQIKV